MLFAAVATMFTACTENTSDDNAGIQSINPLGTPPANAVYYTTLNDQAIELGDNFDAEIVSNTYENGQGTIIFDNNITAIGYKAFIRCYNLTNVALPNDVTTIGICAFRDCFSLRSINIPESITSIGDYAFCNCDGLKKITIPEKVTSIGIGAFSDCNRLTSIYCKAKTPPSSVSLGILDYWVRWITLYVPTGCKAAYEDSDWRGAKEIIETDF